MSCGAKCAKVTLIVFNSLFWIAGAAILGISIWALVDDNASHYLQIISVNNHHNLIKAAAITLCAVGAVIFIVGFFGCFGACNENVCLLNTYIAFVVILLVAQVIAGIMAAVFKDKLLKNLKKNLKKSVEDRYGEDKYPTLTDGWDFVQTRFECCGVTTDPGDDWKNSNWVSKNKPNNVPVTCCVLKNPKASVPEAVDRQKCNQGAIDSTLANRDNFFHKEGCYDTMYNWTREHAIIFIGVAFGLAGLQIILIIVACCLKCSKDKDYQEV